MWWWWLACAPETDPTGALLEGWSDDGELTWSLDFGQPPAVGPTETRVSLLSDGAPYDVEALTLEPWMPEHGHGVSDEPFVERVDAGELVASWVWPMAGTWELRVDADGHGWVSDVVVR